MNLRTDTAGLALALAAIGLYIAAILLMNPDFFYRDDYQAQFMPVFYEVGQALRQGEWLWISERSWNQGNYIGEYQFGIFNPVSLLLMAGLPAIDNTAMAGAYFSGAHLLLSGVGAYWLGRELSLSPHWSAVLSFSLASNALVMYWFAASWIPALVSYAWFIFALAALVRLHQGRSGILMAMLCSYLALVSGWPPTVLAYGAVGTVFFASSMYRSLTGQQNYYPAVALAVAGATAVLASLPAIYPMIAHHALAARTSALQNSGLLVASLEGLLFSFNPGYTPFMKLFAGYRPLPVPMYYSAWFVVLAFAMPAFWKQLPRASVTLLALVACTVIFAGLSMAPTQLGSLRWPFRFIPYFHVCLVALVVVQLARGSASINRAALGGLLLASCYLAAVATLSKTALAGSTLMLVAVGLAYAARRKATLPLLVLALSLAIQVCGQYLFPDHAIPDFKIPHSADQARDRVNTLASERGNTLYLYSKGNYHSIGGEGIIGNMPLWGEGRHTINGYSPVPPKGLANFMCFSHLSASCPQAIDRLTAADPDTEQNYLALMGITRVVAQRGPHARRFARLKPEGWQERMSLGNEHFRVFQQVAPAARLAPGVAWHSPSLSVKALAAPGRFTRHFQVDNGAEVTAPLVLARAWYPGYVAELDGEPVPVKALADMILSVEVPAGAQGELVIRYRPPLWQLTAAAALLALLIAVVADRRYRQRDPS